VSKTGRILLFPCPIVEGNIASLSTECIAMLHCTTHFMVERAKTARHFIKASGHPKAIADLSIYELSEDNLANESFAALNINGTDIGVISEAGCPGVADIVSWAHRNEIEVIPYIGPSSILLALMASGMSGQTFAFNGYLSNKKPDINKDLKNLETLMLRTGQTQIWMETPYRNAFMIESCIQSLQGNTKLCIACDINAPTASIVTKPVNRWAKTDFAIYHKRPTIYLIGK
jgi:16S rRNA (cytidine1402-2'-O)-methyltransferase